MREPAAIAPWRVAFNWERRLMGVYIAKSEPRKATKEPVVMFETRMKWLP